MIGWDQEEDFFAIAIRFYNHAIVQSASGSQPDLDLIWRIYQGLEADKNAASPCDPPWLDPPGEGMCEEGV
ncbi:unnamed protein product [Closterium sp. Naga37s-1]|nr:unnamed protein product [Closterium sp. Naga37s-1]